ncbi:YIP1 family protein [Methanogenium organophilum]|uniref:YIP1 family protein n=1 Tax=Methanogenium organophilum TaxID=2199 RepID=A0A9X9T6L6_METOG|nr:YIP1 family protein [Methanogenium organophilum]WAI00174.1 YIP1 family protein [Methanogenium organophilum]
MSTGFLDNVKGFLLDPTGTLTAHKDESLGDALPYYLILLAIYGLLNGIFIGLGYGIAGSFSGLSAALTAFGAIGTIIVAIVVMIIAGLIALFIGGCILHIFVYIAGGRKDISTTLRAVIYSATPNLLFGWIPFIGFLAGVWSLVLEVLAIRELHEISTARAVIAVILPFILMFVLIALALAFFLISAPTIT